MATRKESVTARARRSVGLDPDVDVPESTSGKLLPRPTLSKRFLDDGKHVASQALQFLYRPDFVDKRLRHEVSRGSQALAGALLPILILASLAIVEAAVGVIASVFLQQDLGDQAGIMGFIVTALAALLFCVTAWGWFQWVRTGGFGLFEF